jgi:hypothetical protein
MKVKIPLDPEEPLYYIIDSCFFANKYLMPNEGENVEDSARIKNSKEWWDIIDYQIKQKNTIVYINDLCISETFKIFAKKYYQKGAFPKDRYQRLRKKLSSDLSLGIRTLISKSRHIKYHNLMVDRDIIVGTSRFLEIAHKNGLQSLSVIDLTILSSAKFLIDFYKIKKEQIIILTGDRKIITCAKKSSDCPYIIDPLDPRNNYSDYFYSKETYV